MATVMRTSDAQKGRLKEQEGLRLDSYQCTAGKWTVGWGHAESNSRPVRGLLDGRYYEGKPKLGVSITLDEARRLFEADLDDFERQVSALITQDLAQHQYDSLIDFAYQFGVGDLKGSTLISKINRNPNNLGEEGRPGILDEFPRWNRENGHRVEHVWRRSCRRACVYANSPIPQALWRKNGFPFALTEDDQIDYAITPTVHRIIAHGKKAAEKPVFDPTKPLPEPSVTIITDVPRTHITDDLQLSPLKPEVILAPKLPTFEEELILDQPAVSEGGPPDANGAELVRPDLPDVQAPKAEENTNSTGVLVGSAERLDPIAPQPPVALPSPLPPVSSAPSAPIGKPKDPPPVIAGQDGAKPKSPWTVQPEEVHYKIDPGAGLKPLEDSDRAKAFYWQRSFMFIIYLGGAGVFGSTFMAGSEVLMKHAALMSVLLDLIVPLAIAASGLLVGAVGKSWADWRRHCAQEKASQGLY